MVRAFVAMGSNLGKRQLALRTAIERMGQLPQTKVEAVGRFRETEPVDSPAGSGMFMNSAVELQTELSATDLMKHLLAIETALGRHREGEQKNGPRVIDLDLVLYGQEVINEPGVTVPHPRMHLRRFVLEPLNDIAPKAVHPVLGKRMEELLVDRMEAV